MGKMSRTLLAVIAVSTAVWMGNVIAGDVSIDITGGTTKVVNGQQFVMEPVMLGQLTPVWAKFKWNAATSSFGLIDFGPYAASATAVGKWMVKFDWYCSGSPYETPFEVNADGTGVFTEYPYAGKWTQNGANFSFTFDEYPTTYKGVVDGAVMKGDMDYNNGEVTGCWSATRAESTFRIVKGQTSNGRDVAGVKR